MTASIASLTAVAGLLSTTPTAATAAPMISWSTIQGSVLSAVSGKLGMSQSDLTAALRTGKSMADVAKTAGVSVNDLTATIESTLAQANLPAGVSLGTMATRMANNVNNAFIANAPAAPATTSAAARTHLGIDTSLVNSVRVGGLSLSSDEVSMLFGLSTGSKLDAYL